MKPIQTISRQNIWIILSIWSLLIIDELLSLQMSLHIPPAVLIGDNITLTCSYDLEGEPLYMVKWYKGQDEFFRITPKELPHTQVFPLAGIHVNVSLSNEHQVLLMFVEKITRGKYRVEVTTDSPNFYTAIESAHLEIIEPPIGEVSLLVEETQYSLGDILRATCRSPMSSPPMNISWHVQGQEIHRGHASVHRITQRLIEESPYPLFTTESHLNYQVNQFKHGRFSLVCEASLYNVLRREVSQDISEKKKPRVSPVIQGETEDLSSDASVCYGSYVLFFLLLLLAHSSKTARP